MDASFNSPLDLQQIFNAAPGLLLVLAPDGPRFTILAATDSYLHATLTQRSELIGRSLFDIYPDNPAYPADSRSRATQKSRASVARAIDTRAPDLMAQQRNDITRSQAAGGGFEERHWVQQNSPVIDASGQLIYLIHSVEDVTGCMPASRPRIDSRNRRFDGALGSNEGVGLAGPREPDALVKLSPRVGDINLDTGSHKQAEQLLRRNHDTFFSLIQNAPFGLYVIDSQFRVCQVSTASRKVFSNIDSLIGRDFEEVLRHIWAEPFASEALARFRHTLATGEPYSAPNTTEQRQNIPDIESYDWKIERITLPDGQFGVVCYFYDITERMQAQAALRESEARYRNLFNSMDEGFCIIDMLFDENEKPVDYRFLEVNPATEKQTGMRDVTGKRVREIIPDLEEYWFEVYGGVALTGKPARFVNEVKTLDRWIEIHAARLGGPNTRQVAVLFDNITERMKADDALRRYEARFRVLFDRGPIAIYSCDASGRMQEFNACAATLWGRVPTPGDSGELFGAAFELRRPDGTLVPRAQTPMADVLSRKIEAVYDKEFIVVRPDGSQVTVIANVVALKNEHAELTGAMCCFYDITERSLLEKQARAQAQALLDLDRRKDEFLAMLSHELRNPLASISNAVQLLGRREDPGPVQHQARAVIERQVRQLKTLVDDLLEVSRISTGRVHMRQHRIDLRSVVESAVETTQPLLAQHRHELAVTQPPEPIWLHADAARLEQVLVNLLTNAAKYTGDGGRIGLSAVQDKDIAVPMAVIKVHDSGIGIAPDLLPHVFDLFTQADRSLDRSEGGLGIGLSLVQRLVQLHGGTVTASSVLGQGSEFAVRLPLLLRSVADPPTGASGALATSLGPFESSGSSAPPAGSSCRVLLVDDNVDSAQTLGLLLGMSGHVVRLAYDGPAAVDAAIEFGPDVVLLDIGLPGLDGYQTAQRIREQAQLKGVVLIALTGYGRDTDRERSQQAGFDHHLVKPASFDAIEKILLGVPGRVA